MAHDKEQNKLEPILAHLIEFIKKISQVSAGPEVSKATE